MDERPPPDPTKMRGVWEAWQRGEALPGRTLADLKIAGFRELIDAEPEGAATAGLLDPWMRFEKGGTKPDEVLNALDRAGIGDVLARLATA